MEFDSIKIKDTNIKLIDGDRGKNYPKKTEMMSHGHTLFLNNKNISGNFLDDSFGDFITEEKSNLLKKGKLNRNDIVLSTRGSVGNVGFYDSQVKNDNIRINSGMIILRNDDEKFLNEYLYLLFKSPYMQNKFKEFVSGSVQNHLPIRDLQHIKIIYPSLFFQAYIVKIIRQIEEKIQINKKLIANLEELSQTLFKRWFVDFEFPDEDGNPYKSSGGEMIDSELGKIPSNWKIYKLKDIASHKKETFNPKKSEEVTVKHFSLPAYDNEEQAIEEEVNKIKSNKWIINNNCVLFSKMNPDTKRIWLPVIDNKKLNVASSEFVVMESPNNKINSFIYNICLNSQFIDYLKSNTTGSTNSRQRVKPTIAVNYKLAVEDSIVEKYSEIITPYMEEMKILRSEIGKLTQLRDTLLPKLMSGELEIPDDIEVNTDELSI